MKKPTTKKLGAGEYLFQASPGIRLIIRRDFYTGRWAVHYENPGVPPWGSNYGSKSQAMVALMRTYG